MKTPSVSAENAMLCQTKKDSLEKRLTSYGVMSLAIAAATAGGTQPAHASVLMPPVSTSTTGEVFFSMGGHAESTVFSGADFGFVRTSSAAFLAGFSGRAFLGANVNGNRLPAPLQAGSLIGTAGQILGTGPGGLRFVTAQQTLASGGGAGFWFPGSQRDRPQYVGLQFDVSGSPHYGWAEITVGADFNITLLAVDANVASSGKPIAAGAAAGAVPEPSSALLLALGAAGLAAYRRKRNRRISLKTV